VLVDGMYLGEETHSPTRAIGFAMSTDPMLARRYDSIVQAEQVSRQSFDSPRNSQIFGRSCYGGDGGTAQNRGPRINGRCTTWRGSSPIISYFAELQETNTAGSKAEPGNQKRAQRSERIRGTGRGRPRRHPTDDNSARGKGEAMASLSNLSSIIRLRLTDIITRESG